MLRRIILAIICTLLLAPSALAAERGTFSSRRALRSEVDQQREAFQALRRGYAAATRYCREQRSLGDTNVVCPDIHDISSYIEFARRYGYGGATVDQTTKTPVSARLLSGRNNLTGSGRTVPTVGDLGGFLNQRAALELQNRTRPTLRDRIEQVRRAYLDKTRRADMPRSITVQP
jgi:hypothetical protein